MVKDLAGRLEVLAASAQKVARGPSKVATLERALRDHVRPGMHLHLVSSLTRPVAVCYELMRRFAGTSPPFTLSAMSLVGPPLLLVEAGLVESVTCAFHGESFPTLGPNPVLQAAWREGRLRLSSWSILSYTQRLLAGALGLPFLPTRSLRGSSMAEENPDLVELEGQLCVRPLVPDIALIHAPAADEFGNTLFGAPFGDAGLGGWAARAGAIVTVERIVSTDEVVEHSPNLRIPGSRVLAVAEVPFGAHPGPLFCGGVEDLVSPYAEDGDFYIEFREACRDPETLRIWTKTWVTSGGHYDYQARLGPSRLARLRGRARPDSWREEAMAAADQILRPESPSPVERAVVAGADILADRVRMAGMTTILTGAGISNLAGWLARAKLAAEGTPVDLMVELGLYGYVPPPGDPLLVSNRVTRTALGLGGVLDILGASLAQTKSVGVLGAGEVDRYGNLNSSRTLSGDLLVGSGGANDVASVAQEVVAVFEQSRKRFVDRVAYLTCPGDQVRFVATQHGLYEKDERGEFVLSAVFGTEADGISAARASCAWDLKISRQLRRLEEPHADELALLRSYDPEGRYLG